jgi:hypothetical protein
MELQCLTSLCFCPCRDRAEERRRGVNPDYASANQLLRTIGTNGDVNVAALSVEDSKYLGGDLEHTHLVKGLDYALLQKVGYQQTVSGRQPVQCDHQQVGYWAEQTCWCCWFLVAMLANARLMFVCCPVTDQEPD